LEDRSSTKEVRSLDQGAKLAHADAKGKSNSPRVVPRAFGNLTVMGTGRYVD